MRVIGGVEVGGDVAEGGDGERLGEGLEVGVGGDVLEEGAGEEDVVGEHLDVAVAAGLLEGEPDFEGAEAAGVLGAEVEVIDGLGAEVVVGGMVGEGVAEVLGIADEGAAGFEGSVEPLVGVDGDGVGEWDGGEGGGSVGEDGGERSVGSVDMEPEVEFVAEGG